jgi:hypothetical protein
LHYIPQLTEHRGVAPRIGRPFAPQLGAFQTFYESLCMFALLVPLAHPSLFAHGRNDLADTRSDSPSPPPPPYGVGPRTRRASPTGNHAVGQIARRVQSGGSRGDSNDSRINGLWKLARTLSWLSWLSWLSSGSWGPEGEEELGRLAGGNARRSGSRPPFPDRSGFAIW